MKSTMLAEVSLEETTYRLEQRLRYTYATPVYALRHRLVVVPRAVHGQHRRIDHGLAVSGSDARVSTSSDHFANHVVELQADRVDELICAERGGVTPMPRDAVHDRQLLDATPLTRPDDSLREAAAELSAAGAGGLDLAERLCAWAHGSLTYGFDVTDVSTTAAEALTGGVGVCQDFAHVMLALCRASGLPARYVSGHLVGEGSSHAWVEVVLTDPAVASAGSAAAVAFDPTHNRRAARDYLTVAIGRDYADVAPTSGTFEGTGPGVLSAHKQLTLLAAG
jgi:transglutaminase-like putative cysteine protease